MLLPINEVYYPSNTKGDIFRVEILIERTADLEKYPEGVRAILKMLRIFLWAAAATRIDERAKEATSLLLIECLCFISW